MEPPLLEAARGRREYFKYDLYDRRTQSVLATQADTSRYYTFVTAGWQEREVFVVRAEGRPARIIGDSASIRSAYCRLAIVPRLLTVHTNVLTIHFTGYLLSQPHSRHRLLACTKLSSAPLGARITRYIPVCLSACSSLYADRHLENEKSYNVQTLRRGCPRHE